jgi:hypothetical protein
MKALKSQYKRSTTKFYNTHQSYIAQAIKQLSPNNIQPLSLKDLIAFGDKPTENTLLSASHYLEKEMPVRIARQVNLIDKLP